MLAELTEELKDPEYAAGYAESYTLSFIASQLKVLREQHGMSQSALAEAIGTQQPGIARLEDCNHTPSLRTLLKLAEAFRLRLHVSFEPYDDLPEMVDKFSRESLERPVSSAHSR